MKNAVLISGKPNALLECAPSIIRNFIEPNNADLFIHYWGESQTPNPVRSDLSYSKTRIPNTVWDLIEKIYSPKSVRQDAPINFPTNKYDSIYQPGDPKFINNVQSMIYGWYQANLLRYHFPMEKYDMVGRIRFDCYLDTEIKFSELDSNKIHLYNDCRHEQGCCNDHLAVGSEASMNIYCSLFEQISNLYVAGCPFSGETLLGRWLKQNNIEISHLDIRHFIWRQMEHLISKHLEDIKRF